MLNMVRNSIFLINLTNTSSKINGYFRCVKLRVQINTKHKLASTNKKCNNLGL
jgi:hypothetical protein